MFDMKRLNERLDVVIKNMRRMASTKCANADVLLHSDEMLKNCIFPALEAYDAELQMLFDQYKEALGKADRLAFGDHPGATGPAKK